MILLGQYISILPFHLISLGFVLLMIVLSDIEAHKWFRGKKVGLKKIKTLHRLVGLGLIFMITTGFIMFWPLRDYLLSNTAFQIKIGFILTLIINSFLINRFIKVVETPFEYLTKSEKRPLVISGAISVISWIGTIVSALSMGL